jgi:hypothetical protein
MQSTLAALAHLSSSRSLAVDTQGMLYLQWDDVTLRMPLYDLGHLVMILDGWEEGEEAGALRRGYYRLCQSPDGGVQLWLNNGGLCLSRHDLRQLAQLLRNAEELLQQPGGLQQNPFSAEYRVLVASSAWQN